MNEENSASTVPSFEQSVFLMVNRQMIPLEKSKIRIGRQLASGRNSARGIPPRFSLARVTLLL